MKQLGPGRRRHSIKAAVVAAALTVLTATVTSATSAAQTGGPTGATGTPSPSPSPEIEPPPTQENPEVLVYGDDSIVWWGADCESVVVIVTVTYEPNEPQDLVGWDSGENCEPIITNPPRGDWRGR